MSLDKKWSLILLLALPFFATGCAGFLAKSLMQPARQPILKTPSDYNMDFEEVSFSSPDGVALQGWLIPADSDRLVIVTHPMTFSKYGFSAAHQGLFKVTKLDVEFLNTVHRLHDAGDGVLIFDFRNHGVSDEAHDGFSAVGLFEWQDVVGALDYVASRADLKEKRLAFVSHCMGANATLIAFSKAREKFSAVQAIVAIQPVSADIFTQSLLDDKYPLFSGQYKGINRKIKQYTGFTLEEMSPLDYVQDLTVPVLYVQERADPWTRPEDVQSFYDRTPGTKELLWLDGKERFEGYNYFGDHPEKMLSFLQTYS